MNYTSPRKLGRSRQWFQEKFKKEENWLLEGTENKVDEHMTSITYVILEQLILTSVAMPSFSENERVFDSGKHFLDLTDQRHNGLEDARSIALFALAMAAYRESGELIQNDGTVSHNPLPPVWPINRFDQTTTPRPEPDPAREQAEDEQARAEIRSGRGSLPTETIASVPPPEESGPV